jgi:hypothetical protein
MREREREGRECFMHSRFFMDDMDGMDNMDSMDITPGNPQSVARSPWSVVRSQ